MADETSSVNNTNSLDDNPGVGVRNYSSYTSQMIDVERSRENYKKANSAKLEKIKDAVYKTVSTWSEEDKYRVISEHGDADLLKQNPHGDKLNSLCTETLIIHLPIEDLNQILNDTKVSERELANQVKAINKETKREADRLAAIAKKNASRTSFNAGTFSEFAGVMTSNDTNKTMLKKISKKDPTYKIPKYILMQFTRLRKELSNVIDECFNKLDLAEIAVEMGMDIGNDEDVLKKSIINKTILYVALITGKSKDDNLGNAIMDPTPYNNLLKYTSYSYVTGEPGLDLSAWKTLRNEARIAKKRIEVISKMQKQRASRHSSAFAALSGGNKTAKDIAKNDRGALANLSDEELITLAARYGIDPQKYSIGKLKLELYRAMAANNRALSALDNEAAKAKSKRRFTDQGVLDAISIRKDFTIGNKNTITSATGSGNIPTISFNANGVRIDDAISKAVPVYVVGSGQVVMGKGSPIETAVVKRASSNKQDGAFVSPNTLDTSFNRRKSLSDSDRITLNHILSLTGGDRDKFINDQLKFKVNSGLLQYIASFNSANDTAQTRDEKTPYTDYDKNVAYAWVFSIINHRKELQAYIEKNMYNGKPPFKPSDVVPSKWTKVAGVLNKPIKAISDTINAFKNFGNRIKTNKQIRKNGGIPTSIDQLPTTQQDFYYNELELVKKNPDSYALAIGKHYRMKDDFSGGKQGNDYLYVAPSYGNLMLQVKAYYPNDSQESIKNKVYNTLIMLKANIEGQRLLAKYLESTNEIISLKNFKKNAGFLGINTITRAVNSIRNPISKIFGGSNKSVLAGTENGDIDVSEEKSTDNGNSTLSPSGIPLIKLSGKDKEGSMAVPVYVVNQQEAGDVKSGIKKLFTVQDTKTRRKKGDKTSEPGKYNTSLVIPFKSVSDVVSSKTKENLGLSTKTALTRVVFSSVVVNKELSELSDNTSNILSRITTTNTLLDSLLTGFSTPAALAGAPTMTGTLTFPGMATAKVIANATTKLEEIKTSATEVNNIMGKATGVYNHTGARISKLASGGTVSIAGDAASSNIFANGAKPELVQSSGDMTVTPLHEGGPSTKQNVRKMTLNERSSALATSIASHVIKVSYKLPDGAQDVSNPGEAIKVYNVKPGISDEVDLGNGNSASLIALVANIYTQLTAMATQDQTNGQLLSTIAANTTNTGASQQASIQSNPFAGGFPTSLDDILSGE